jgi:hypothetical protein
MYHVSADLCLVSMMALTVLVPDTAAAARQTAIKPVLHPNIPPRVVLLCCRRQMDAIRRLSQPTSRAALCIAAA